MITIDSMLDDGRSALAGLEGASPSGGQVTSRPRPRTDIKPGDVVRHHGTWMAVEDIRHDGLHGITQAALVDAAGVLLPHSMTGHEGMTVRTDTRIDPDTLYKIRRPGGRPGGPEGPSTVNVAFTWQQDCSYRSTLDLSGADITAAGFDPNDPSGVLAYLRAEAAGCGWVTRLDPARDVHEVISRTVDSVTIPVVSGGASAGRRRAGPPLMASVRGTGPKTQSATARNYEGYAVFADGSKVSLQCYDGRHGECPDITPPGAEDSHGGPFGGHYCECSGCPGHPTAASSLARRAALQLHAAELTWQAADADMPRSAMYCLEALGLSIIVRRRQGGSYIHIDTQELAEEPLLPLEVEVNNGGEASYT